MAENRSAMSARLVSSTLTISATASFRCKLCMMSDVKYVLCLRARATGRKSSAKCCDWAPGSVVRSSARLPALVRSIISCSNVASGGVKK